MNPANIQPQKETRGHASLERKLAFLEFGRRFWLVISIDILIILMFFCAMIIRAERFSKNMNFYDSPDNSLVNGFVITESTDRPEGFKLEKHVSAALRENRGIIRNLWFDETFNNHPFYTYFESLKYSINIPTETGKYLCVTFSFYEAVSVFEYAFVFILIFEGIGLISDSFKIRRSIRHTLRPLYDLTLAAQTVNMSSNNVMALPGAQELHLSGAIDTLNTITENDLDRRIVITDDREELRGLAQAINAMLDRLDAAYRSQLRFVSDASHELRTPIAVIQGYANLLDRWGKNDQITLQESIDAIKSEASSMQDLVEQLLFLARSDNRSIVLNVEVVNIFALADEVFRETQMIDPSHEFQSRLTEGLMVRGDMQLLKQAIRIFVDNAIKYTPSGGKITISTLEEADFVKISVSDNGIGIPADDLARVFDRFFRSDESRTRGTGGTGLGLSIAKWIIDRHGGYVEIISREDIGTKVTVALPSHNTDL